jgi:DNA-binding transcriptional regulator YiaG
MGGKSGISGREVQYNAEISRRIEEYRTQYRVRRCELARAAHVSQQMLRAYEVGMSRWPVFRVRLIAEYLGVDVDEQENMF